MTKKEETAAYNKEYRKKNKEKIAAYRKDYYQKNKQKEIATSREYYHNNKEKEAARCKKYCQDNKEKVYAKQKEYRQKNRDNRRAYSREYYQKNKESWVYSKKYYQKNKEKISARHKEYRQKNKEKLTAKNNEYHKIRYNQDPIFKLKRNLSSMIRASFSRKCYVKDSRTYEILGCSYEAFIEYLNDNEYGFKHEDGGYDLDHIIPISSAVTKEDVLRLNHYTNFQLLPAQYNRTIKRDRTFSPERLKEYLSSCP